MNAPRRFATIISGIAMSILAACSKPAPPPPVPVAAPTPNTDSLRRVRDAQVRADSVARDASMRRAADQRRADSISAANAARDAESMRRTIATPVYFDFDRSELRGDTREVLDAKLPILLANSGLAIRIAGHTDERGSGEYNLQLGQRRAASVRDYLVARGVVTGRVELVSYGKERPVCQEKNEACWSRNRRAEFEITAGASMLRKP